MTETQALTTSERASMEVAVSVDVVDLQRLIDWRVQGTPKASRTVSLEHTQARVVFT